MHDLDVLKNARESMRMDATPFLEAHREHAQHSRPYDGLTILHNVPLTMATVFKIEALALGGASVTVTSPSFFPIEKRASDLLAKANFTISVEPPAGETFDIHLDYGAELMRAKPPKLGAVELTQSGSKIYKFSDTDYPVVSVNDSKLKVLEAFFGAGDGFYRALSQELGIKLHNKSFVIFGHGNVGRGILYALKQITTDLTVIDTDKNISMRDPDVKYIDAFDIDQIKDVLLTAYCTITATGIKHLISEHYLLHKKDFGASILTNMGSDDEYGPNFKSDDVLFDKRSFNLSLKEPTAFRYLDPIFYSHNIGVDLILSKQVNKGYNPFPHNLAHKILKQWQSIYNENMHEALRG